MRLMCFAAAAIGLALAAPVPAFAANAPDVAEYSARLQAARQEARLALRAAETRRLAGAGGAPDAVSTLD